MADKSDKTQSEISEEDFVKGLKDIGINPKQELSNGSVIRDETPLPISEEEFKAEAENFKKYGDRGLEAAATSALGGLTFGASNLLLDAFGTLSKEDNRKLRKYNKTESDIGDIAGIVIPVAATGGLGAGASIARKTATGLAEEAGVITEKILENAIKKSSNQLLAKDVVAKSLQGAAREGVSGGIYNLSQFADETSIGETDFTAQNLMNYVGSGIFTGGIAGAAFPVLGHGIKSTYSAGKKLFNKAAKESAAPLGMSLFQTMGDTAVQAAKRIELEPELETELMEWLGNKIKNGELSDKLHGEDFLSQWKNITKRSGKVADDIFEETDALVKDGVSGSQPGLIATRKRVLTDVAGIMDDFVRHQDEYGLSSDKLKKFTAWRDQYLEHANRGTAVRPSDLRKFKQELSEEITQIRAAGDYSAKEIAATRGIQRLDEAMHEMVSLINPSKAQALKESFQDLKLTLKFDDRLAIKTHKEYQTILPKLLDMFNAAGMIHMMGTAGGILAAGTKFVHSDLHRRLSVLSALKKANIETNNKIVDGVSRFAAFKGVPKKASTVSVLMLSDFAKGDNKEKPKNRQEAYKNVSKNLNELSANPEKLLDRTAKATAMLSQVAPTVAIEVSGAMVRASQFLQSKLPQSPYMDTMPGMKKKEYIPSSMELAKFERYLQVIEKPISVVDEIEQGTLTRDHIEALKAVYPAFYENIRSIAINKLQATGDVDVSYSKRIQMGILLDIPADASMLGINIAALQANFKVQEQPEGGAVPVVNPTQGGAENIKHSERMATDTQAFASRRNETE